MIRGIVQGGHLKKFVSWYSQQPSSVRKLVNEDIRTEMVADSLSDSSPWITYGAAYEDLDGGQRKRVYGGMMKRKADQITASVPEEITRYTVDFLNMSPRFHSVELWQAFFTSLVGQGAFVTKVQFFMAEKRAKVHFYAVYPYESHVISLLLGNTQFPVHQGSLKRVGAQMETE